MRWSKPGLREAAAAAMVAGTLLITVGGLLMFHGDGSDPATSKDRTGSQASVPFGTDTNEVEAVKPLPSPTPSPTPTAQADTSLGFKKPFGKAAGDNTPHSVTITIKSDGAVYIGFRFYQGTKGYRFANRSFTITRTVHGAKPLAQVGVKYESNATYATCSISVDGVVINSNRTGKKFAVTVCGA